ncbi:unnamed protein product [Linum tenue]|uniref:Uncharacterized protein n=1 Tax=Linum tenue TaxID=586396 RepID=A0AAV0N8Z8_9ROSI|nr:unnamed protein product [Linum tenue]
MASSEVEKITEPVSITQEVEGVKSYLTPEVEAAVVSLAKSDEMLKLQHNLPDGNNSSISEVPEDESFLESSSSGIKVSGQDPCEKEQVNTSQADEPIAAKSCQVQHESIEEAGLDAVVEDRVSPGIEAAEQISTPEIRLVQNEAAASETCLENGSQDNDFSSGVEGKDLEPENEEANKSEMASSVENEVAEKGNVVLETGLQDEEKPADPEDVKDGVLVQEKNSIATEANEIAECAEEARISNDKPDEAMAAEAETMVEKTLHSESHEEANEQNEAAVETEKHIESESRELGEPAVAELVTMSAESETETEKQEQVDEPDSKEGLEIHNYGASKEVVQTEEEAYDAKTPELETKSNHDDTVNKEGSSKEITTVSDDDKVEEPVKENTVHDLKIDDQSARKEDIATPVESDVAEKENTGEIGVQEEEKTADFDDVRDNEVVLQEKTANATEANETAESAETKISDDKPDEAQKVESETVEKKPLHSESREEATYQQNEAPAEIENHIGSEPSAELVTKNGEIDDEKQEEIVQPESSEAPKVHHDAETSKEEEKVQTKEETSDAQKTELEPMSNEDDTVKELETNPTLGIDEALEKTAARREDPTIHIVEKEVEIQKEEFSKEDMKGDDAVDVIEEPAKEDTAEEIKIDDHSDSKEIIEETKRVDSSVEDPEKNEQSPKVTLETPPQGEKEGQEDDEKEEQKTEGVEEEEVPKKNESVEASEETITLGVSSPNDEKEEAEEINKETTETVDESSPPTQDHESCDSTVQTSVEKEEVSRESENIGVPVESNEKSKGVEEVEEISNKETSNVAEAEQLVIPVFLPESEGDSSSKLDHGVSEEKTEISEEDAKGDLSNEIHATDTIEQTPVEDLQKSEETVEHSNREVLEKSETAAEVESGSTAHETEQDDGVVTEIASTIEVKTEVPETDEIIEKETPKGEEVESVLQEEKEQETRTSTEENPEELVTKHKITTKDQTTEASVEIQTIDDKLPVDEKEVPEIIQSADEDKELENTMEDKEESTKEMPELVQSENVVEPVLGEEGEKEGVTEEKESVKPEAAEAIDTTQEGNMIEEVRESIPSSTESDKGTDSNEQKEVVAAIIQSSPTLDKDTLVEETTEDENTMVEGTENPLVDCSAAASVEESEETSKEETIEEDHEEMKHIADEFCESRLPAAGILESAAMQEEEVKGNVESVIEESNAVQEHLPEENQVVQSSEVPAHEDDYETIAVIENTEEEETKNVLVSQPDTSHDPLELQTTEDTSLKEFQPRELESEASTKNKPVEEQTKEASEGLEATTEDKLTDEKSIKEEKAEEQHQEEEEEEKESSIETAEMKDELPETEAETEGESCSQDQVKIPEDAAKEEVSVSDEMDQKQEVSDSTGNEAIEDDEVPAAQALPEEPEVMQDEPKQEEAECKPEGIEKENQVKEIQEDVNAFASDISEQTEEIPEASVAENTAKQTEEGEVEALVEQDKVEKQVGKSDDISGGETNAATEETSGGISEDKSKQVEDEPLEQQEARELDVTTQVDPQVEEDVQECNEVQKGDDAAVDTEETKEVSALTTIAGEAIRPVEQVSREFQVSELEPEVEKGSQESEGSAITEETEVVSQETKPLEENETTQLESSSVEKPEEEHPEVLETSKSIEETLKESKEMEDDASLIKEEAIVGQQKEGPEEKEESSEPSSNFEFPGFIQPKELEQQVTTECPYGSEESKETAETQENTVDISAVIKKETLESASEGSSQAVITKPVDNAENQPEASGAEMVIKEKEIIQESKPESEQKAERIPEEEIEPKESRNDEVSRQKESIPSECDVKIVEEEEAKVKTEEGKAEATTLIDKELGNEISQRDLPVELVEEATSEKQISTEAKPSAGDETINPAKVSLFDMMAKSTRERKVVLEPTEEKEPQPAVTRDETKAAEAEPEKAKSDNEKENDEERQEEEQDEGEDQHKNDSGSDGMVIVEASKETEVKVVTTPQKKSHNILSEVGSKVKHSISKVRKVITGKSSHQSKQKSPEKNSPK